MNEEDERTFVGKIYVVVPNTRDYAMTQEEHEESVLADALQAILESATNPVNFEIEELL